MTPWCLVADVIRQHRAEHAQSVLIAACQEAIQTGAVEPVLDRFIALVAAFGPRFRLPAAALRGLIFDGPHLKSANV